MSGIINLKTLEGLSEKIAEERLQQEGFNELPSTKAQSTWEIMSEVVREPMFLLLVGCACIYLFLGDLREAVMLMSFVLVVMSITVYQERKTEKALTALRNLSSPRASVIRDGQKKKIAGREVVRDDIILLAEGDRVPADAVVVTSINLAADESLLTGESVAVRKMPWDGSQNYSQPGGDDLPFVYSGTLIVQGQGMAQVRAVGMNTEIGKIGRALQSVEPEDTMLKKQTNKLVKNLTIFGLGLCSLVVIIYGITRGDWLNGLLAGITLAMATLPEEFPVVLTVFLAIGAWRMSRKNVLTRRVTALETLGAATVLCVDKTGTLTFNQMMVQQVCVNNQLYDIDFTDIKSMPETLHTIVEYSILASQKDPFDPMERAFKKLGEHFLNNTEHLHHDWRLVHQYPLSTKLLALSHVWQSPNGTDYIIAAKGAPEAIGDLCHLIPEEMSQMTKSVDAMASAGLRVLGVARAKFRETQLPEIQHDFVFEYLGLIGLADPVRPTVATAVQECRTAGIRVIMITGDYARTASTIAHQINLTNTDDVITGAKLDQMTDSELQKRMKSVHVFARVVPEQKLRIVNALKSNGEIVAMTGDGVNDAPALKSAHIGIAMGGRGTDVAREAASLVLLDDDFNSIVEAIKMGRRIFDNLRKAMAYILAIHVPIAGLSFFPVLFYWPLILLPVHVVFLELIIDPACSVVFEAEEADLNIMQRPPRNSQEPLFSRKVIVLSILQGLSVLVVSIGVFVFAGYRGLDENSSRAITFLTLIIANLGLIFTNRSWSDNLLATMRRHNAALWFVVGGALSFLVIIFCFPSLLSLFRFSVLSSIDIITGIIAGCLSIVWFEGWKIFKKSK